MLEHRPTTIPDKPRRRWFAFSLRTLFVLVTILGVWMGVQVKWIRDRHDAQKWIDSQGGDFVTEGGHFRFKLPGGAVAEGDGIVTFNHLRAPWSIRSIGADNVYFIVVPRNGDDQSMDSKIRELRQLFPEADVQMDVPTLSAAALRSGMMGTKGFSLL